MLLAYDQGMEHGPVDFNEKSVDPNYIMKIAQNGNFTGVVFQEGIAALRSALSGRSMLLVFRPRLHR